MSFKARGTKATSINARFDEVDSAIATLDEKTDALDRKIDEKTDALDRKIDALDRKIDEKTDALDRKIDALDRKIDEKTDALDQKIDTLEQKMDRGFDEVNRSIGDMAIHIAEVVRSSLSEELTRHVKAYSEENRKRIDALDDRYQAVPAQLHAVREDLDAHVSDDSRHR